MKPQPRYIQICETDPDHAFVVVTATGWLLRMPDLAAHIGRPLAVCLVWLLGDELEHVIRELAPSRRDGEASQGDEAGAAEGDPSLANIKEDKEAGEEEIAPGRARIPDQLKLKALMALARRREPRLGEELEQALARRRRVLKGTGRSQLRCNLACIRRLFCLDAAERKLLLFSYLTAANPHLRDLFRSQLQSPGGPARRLVGRLLGLSLQKVEAALRGRFLHLCLQDPAGHAMALNEDLWALLEDSPDELVEN